MYKLHSYITLEELDWVQFGLMIVLWLYWSDRDHFDQEVENYVDSVRMVGANGDKESNIMAQLPAVFKNPILLKTLNGMLVVPALPRMLCRVCHYPCAALAI
jgi:hypothetical protein